MNKYTIVVYDAAGPHTESVQSDSFFVDEGGHLLFSVTEDGDDFDIVSIFRAGHWAQVSKT